MVKSPSFLPIVAFAVRIAVLVVPLPLIAATNGPTASCPQDFKDLIAKLETKGEEQTKAIAALSRCKDAADPLIRELANNPENNPNVEARSAMVEALEQMGTPAIDGLVKVVGDRNNPEVARSLAIGVLAHIAQAEKTEISEKTRIVQRLAERKADSQESVLIRINADQALRQISNPTVKSAVQKTPAEQIQGWIEKNPKIAIGIAALSVLGIIYLVILWVKPRFLLFMPSGPWKIPNTSIELPTGLLRWLKYQPRVLDHWIEEYLKNNDAVGFHKQLLTRDMENQQSIYVPIPVNLDGKLIDELSRKDLRPVFDKPRFDHPTCLLIVGDGGVGKTSLACQIARWGMSQEQDNSNRLCKHRMLPVLIDEDLKTPLLKEIQNQLPRSNGDLIDEELLKVLLKKRRVLVIIDHASELSDSKDDPVYQKIEEELKNNPINALIVTSRREEKNLGQSQRTLLQPQKIQGNKLSGFVDLYLRKKGVRDRIEDQIFFAACKQLTDMVAPEMVTVSEQENKGATVLLAKLYAEDFIDKGMLPRPARQTIPDLMLSYVERLNNSIDKNKRIDKNAVYRDAQAVAWECLKRTYQPNAAFYHEVEQALMDLSDRQDNGEKKQDAIKRLKYLEEDLRLLERPQDKVRLTLDPLAEYLAGLHLVDAVSPENIDVYWQNFFESLSKFNLPEIRGFLKAVRNCYDRRLDQKADVPPRILEELNNRLDLNSEEIRRIKQQKQIDRWIETLQDAPDDKDRVQAARELARLGVIARSAIPVLWATLKRESETMVVRRSAALALRRLGEDVPDLVVEITGDGSERILFLEPPVTVREDLGNGVVLELVQIPAGSFWMGSPEDEEDSNDDECPQHEVTIAKPFLMGRYPVTQAQWRAVAALSKVDQDLEPDPSSFEGDDCPVESVSWWDAIEFCQRLLKRTGKEYRLPSEAEWEYACRAGTDTPYHFGETITEELANFSGRNTPNRTTPVGEYGVTNRFGLYDMHGNVWEWCADHWHGNYEDAPVDGSAWLTDNQDAERVWRGGSWHHDPMSCRSAFRHCNYPGHRFNNLGFRVVCGLA